MKFIKSHEIKIRLLQQQDIEILSEINFLWNSKEDRILKWTRYLDEQVKKSRLSFIVENEGKVFGYGNLLLNSQYPYFRNANIPEINDIWIIEERRKRGIGTLLISHLELVAKKQGYAQIGIGVGLYSDYGAAQKLYFKLGYTPDGNGITYNNSAVIPGEKYPVDDELILWLIKKTVD